jgi:protocatechuate 3,4-dioxygenase alpha subunit
MNQKPLTPAQTVGPFFHPGMLRDGIPAHQIARPGTSGEHIRVTGRVLDGEGQPIPDALIEVWQANSQGRFQHPADRRPLPLDAGFIGFGRVGTDEDGRYFFDTVKPGRVPFRADAPGAELQAPHLSLTVLARGLLHHLLTRVYFSDEPSNAADPILALVPAERRATLIARREDTPAGAVVYHLDIVLQGAGETVFFNPVKG